MQRLPLEGLGGMQGIKIGQSHARQTPSQLCYCSGLPSSHLNVRILSGIWGEEKMQWDFDMDVSLPEDQSVTAVACPEASPEGGMAARASWQRKREACV